MINVDVMKSSIGWNLNPSDDWLSDWYSFSQSNHYWWIMFITIDMINVDVMKSSIGWNQNPSDDGLSDW